MVRIDDDYNGQTLAAPSSSSQQHSVGISKEVPIKRAQTTLPHQMPMSPLVAASTAGEKYPATQLSYAHRRSVSGWDKLFSSISQRGGSPADVHNHEIAPDNHDTEHRVPGIGEDYLAPGDVQYVYE